MQQLDTVELQPATWVKVAEAFHVADCLNYRYKPPQIERMPVPINLEYPGAECPDCGEPINDDKEAGQECDGCGHVFHEYSPVDDVREDEDFDPLDERDATVLESDVRK